MLLPWKAGIRGGPVESGCAACSGCWIWERRLSDGQLKHSGLLWRRRLVLRRLHPKLRLPLCVRHRWSHRCDIRGHLHGNSRPGVFGVLWIRTLWRWKQQMQKKIIQIWWWSLSWLVKVGLMMHSIMRMNAHSFSMMNVLLFDYCSIPHTVFKNSKQ